MGSSLANAMRDWVAAIPVLLSDELDDQGNRLPFDRRLIFPYAFRHAYAQRHADAGVPVDVLKELMDYRSIVTTMSYGVVHDSGGGSPRRIADVGGPR
ncbi:hypothetical protein ABT001_32785 [Streptomyces sp. NPDC002793]|uniref:hypothetical protein n=1 Tax=Streptomyces sp. NPDC002793 TaxID=3154432 RepID=UPI00332CFCAB